MGSTDKGETLDFLSIVDNSCSILEDQVLGEAEEDGERGNCNPFPDAASIASCGRGSTGENVRACSLYREFIHWIIIDSDIS